MWQGFWSQPFSWQQGDLMGSLPFWTFIPLLKQEPGHGQQGLSQVWADVQTVSHTLWPGAGPVAAVS